MTNNTILIDPDESELIAAVQENIYAWFRSLQSVPGCELLETDTLSLHHVPLANPIFRGAWRTRLAAEEAETRIDEVVAWFKQQQAADFFWWTDAQTQPTDMVERLLHRGFDGNREGDPGMVANLYRLNEHLQTPANFHIRQALDPQALADWRDAFVAAFEMPLSGGQAWLDAIRSITQEPVPWQLYIGYLDQQPVASSMLFMSAGVAGIYSVGTLPSARKRGIGTAMTLHPLLEARQQGYHYAILFASRMGNSVYKRIGFREVACTIGVYMLEIDQ
jgi:ribosomal protein S18 acetylase RimI-like enzyme